MNKILSTIIAAIIGLFGVHSAVSPSLGGASVFNSSQVGTGAASGSVLQTNGTISTWTATSSLGISTGLSSYNVTTANGLIGVVTTTTSTTLTASTSPTYTTLTLTNPLAAGSGGTGTTTSLGSNAFNSTAFISNISTTPWTTGNPTVVSSSGALATVPSRLSWADGNMFIGGGQTLTVNAVSIYGPFYLDNSITNTHITFGMATVDAATSTDFYDVGIYNASGTLVIDVGTTTMRNYINMGTTILGNPTSTTSGATFPPGNYYVAMTGNSTTAKFYPINAANSWAVPLAYGTSTASTGGLLPATATIPTISYNATSAIASFEFLPPFIGIY